MSKKLKHEVVKEVLDPNTGELIKLSTEKVYSIQTTSQEFYMTFVENMKGLFSLSAGSDIKLIAALCVRAKFDTGTVDLTPFVKDEISKEVGINLPQISKSLKSLTDKGLINISKGRIEISPFVFWKGNTATRERLLKEGGLELKIKFKLE